MKTVVPNEKAQRCADGGLGLQARRNRRIRCSKSSASPQRSLLLPCLRVWLAVSVPISSSSVEVDELLPRNKAYVTVNKKEVEPLSVPKRLLIRAYKSI